MLTVIAPLLDAAVTVNVARPVGVPGGTERAEPALPQLVIARAMTKTKKHMPKANRGCGVLCSQIAPAARSADKIGGWPGFCFSLRFIRRLYHSKKSPVSYNAMFGRPALDGFQERSFYQGRPSVPQGKPFLRQGK